MSDSKKKENSGNRAIEILKAAIPYMDWPAKKSMQVVVQADELLSFIKEVEEPTELSACDMDGGPTVDMEAMLLDIRGLCTVAEQEMIDMILNLLQAQKMFSLYRTFMASKSESDQNERDSGNPFGDNAMMEFMMSQMPPEQRANFENMSMMMSMMNMT